MTSHAIRGKRAQPGKATRDRWTALCENDGAGIDGDIEELIGSLQERLGLGRGSALSELVRRLSIFDDGLEGRAANEPGSPALNAPRSHGSHARTRQLIASSPAVLIA